VAGVVNIHTLEEIKEGEEILVHYMGHFKPAPKKSWPLGTCTCCD